MTDKECLIEIEKYAAGVNASQPLLKLLALGDHEIKAGKTKPLVDIVQRLRKQKRA